MPARTLAVTYTAACEQNFSGATRNAIWGWFSAENRTFHKKHRSMVRRTFATDTESEEEDFDPPEDNRKSTSADELSSSDNENSAPDDEESDLGQEFRLRQRIPWQLVNKWDPAEHDAEFILQCIKKSCRWVYARKWIDVSLRDRKILECGHLQAQNLALP